MPPPSIVKFKVQFVSRDVPDDPRVEQLRAWCERFNESGLTPQLAGAGRSLGNLSFRLRAGERAFVITGSTLSTKQTLSPSDFVVTVCEANKRYILEQHGGGSLDLRVLYNGVDVSAFHPKSRQPDAHRAEGERAGTGGGRGR